MHPSVFHRGATLGSNFWDKALVSDDAGYVSAVNLCVDAGWETSAPDLAPFRPQILATK
jgi:hypothetical protein